MEPFSEQLRKDHILSGTDARIKLVVAVAILVMVLTYKGFVFPLLVALLCFALCIKMKIPLNIFVLRFSEPMFIAFVLIIIKLLFSGKDVLFSMHFPGFTITGHRDGLMEGLLLAARIVGAVSVVAVLGFATPFTELMAGLSWFRVPKGFIEVLMFAYRYIFDLLEEAMVIYNAQKNRLGYSSIRRGLSSFGILTGSLILKAFEHSQNTTVAMVQRGYDGTIPLLTHKPFKVSEISVSMLFLSVMGLIWKI
jgi:cobalt/nickel transport system permease protein